jgi:hypothetical protein
MSDITLKIGVENPALNFNVTDNLVKFTPTDFKINIYATGKMGNVIPAAGSEGQLQYNSGGVLAATPYTTYDVATSKLLLGPISAVGVGGGTSGQVLSTNGANSLTWTSVIANATYANVSGKAEIANFANFAGVANTANYATTSNLANYAGVANLANRANALSANIADVYITGGNTGQYLKTDGTGALSWANVSTVTALANLTDVTVGNVSNGQSLVYITANSRWEPRLIGNGSSGVSQIFASDGISITPSNGTGAVTIKSNVAGIVAGTNVTVDVANGVYTINAGGGDGNVSIAGSNTQVQFNDSNILGASANFTFNKTSNTLAVGALATLSANLGSNANLKITGGSANQFLRTDGAGNLTWANSGSGVTALANLTDVDVLSPTDGQFLAYTSSNSKWTSKTLTTGSAEVPVYLRTGVANADIATGTITLVGRTANYSSPAIIANTYFTTGGNTTINGSTTLSGLTDVSVSGVTNGQVLTYNSSIFRWVPTTPSSTGGSTGGSLDFGTILSPSGFSLNLGSIV